MERKLKQIRDKIEKDKLELLENLTEKEIAIGLEFIADNDNKLVFYRNTEAGSFAKHQMVYTRNRIFEKMFTKEEIELLKEIKYLTWILNYSDDAKGIRQEYVPVSPYDDILCTIIELEGEEVLIDPYHLEIQYKDLETGEIVIRHAN
jgi:hypothetical protein